MAKISVRTVPRQNPSRLVDLIRAHLKHEFGKRRSPNDLFIEVKKVGDWWYGDRGAEAFGMAERAIEEVWGQPPLYVREGGTMPITAFLEDLLKAPALHLPLGQSTDNAHLPNERIRYLNLTNGKEIIKNILSQVGERSRVQLQQAQAAMMEEKQQQQQQGGGGGGHSRNVSGASVGGSDDSGHNLSLAVPPARRASSVLSATSSSNLGFAHNNLTPLQTEPLVTRPSIARSSTPTPPSSHHAHNLSMSGSGVGGRDGGMRSPPISPTFALFGSGAGAGNGNGGAGTPTGGVGGWGKGGKVGGTPGGGGDRKAAFPPL